jgi:nitrogen fixation protein FixH
MKTLIVTVTVIALVAVIGSIIVGERAFDGLVVEKPYDKGLQWDRDHTEKAGLGWNVFIKNRNLHTGDNDLIFSVLDKGGKPVEDVMATVLVTRPSTTAYDKYYEPSAQGNGTYKISVHFPLYGYWYVRINVAHERKNIVFEEKVYAEP